MSSRAAFIFARIIARRKQPHDRKSGGVRRIKFCAHDCLAAAHAGASPVRISMLPAEVGDHCQPAKGHASQIVLQSAGVTAWHGMFAPSFRPSSFRSQRGIFSSRARFSAESSGGGGPATAATTGDRPGPPASLDLKDVAFRFK